MVVDRWKATRKALKRLWFDFDAKLLEECRSVPPGYELVLTLNGGDRESWRLVVPADFARVEEVRRLVGRVASAYAHDGATVNKSGSELLR